MMQIPLENVLAALQLKLILMRSRGIFILLLWENPGTGVMTRVMSPTSPLPPSCRAETLQSRVASLYCLTSTVSLFDVGISTTFFAQIQLNLFSVLPHKDFFFFFFGFQG